jgi:hypothetical protein
MATSANPHHVPGMGYAKNNPAPRGGGLQSVVCRTVCGEIELKITLTAKFLSRPIKDALVEPFLKVHNKRAPEAISWENIKCIKIDGITLDVAEMHGATAESVLQKATTQVLLLTSVPTSLTESLIAVAREREELTRENYRNPPPPCMTRELIRIAQLAADSVQDAAEDADAMRRCTNAFQAISGGDLAVVGAAVREAFLRDEYVRSLYLPASSVHMAALDNALSRMAVDRAEAAIEMAQFSRFFAAVAAAACAPANAAEEVPDPETSSAGHGMSGDAGGLLSKLLDDERVSARRIA